jgi:hypothetical protein
MRSRRRGRHFKSLRPTPSRNVDADLIISAVVLALVALIGANTWLILTVRDKIGKVDRRIENQNQRLTKVIEWAEDQGSPKRGK